MGVSKNLIASDTFIQRDVILFTRVCFGGSKPSQKAQRIIKI